jgi:hypothetical protein
MSFPRQGSAGEQAVFLRWDRACGPAPTYGRIEPLGCRAIWAHPTRACWHRQRLQASSEAMWSCWQVTVHPLAGPRERACQREAVDKLSMAVYLGITYWLSHKSRRAYRKCGTAVTRDVE